MHSQGSIGIRRESQIRRQLSTASPTNRSQPTVIITKVIIKLKLWPAAGCEAKLAVELSSRPLVLFLMSNECPYFSQYNPKTSASNSLYFGSFSRKCTYFRGTNFDFLMYLFS